ncbi:MAG TPA: DUF1501 domain-containing protein [Planctomycetaceae bacterium]|jgi:uncharacterized protein (DUF1501 family)|nr:DUF1501 domain-containing protein [Planctomycetaceae bacterium]
MPNRRDFLKQATLISLAPSVPSFLAETARAAVPSRDDRVLVVIQLDGGNDGLNTVIPYADENYARLRPNLAIPKQRVRRLNDAIGLNPAMREAVELFHDGRLAIVQGVGYPNPNKSHEVSKSIWETARFDPTEHSSYGWIGRALDEAPAAQHSGPACVLVGTESVPTALRGRKSIASALSNLDDMVIGQPVKPSGAASSDDSLLAFVRRSTVDAVVTADRLQQAAKSRPDATTSFESEFSKRLMLIARLIQSDFGARVYYAVHTGYDTHVYQRETHDRLLRELSEGLRSFLDQLKRAKLDDRVAVMTFSEFGRRADENASEGTDHGAAAPLLLAGAKIKSGLHGSPPNLAQLRGGDLVSSIDFRQVYQAVLEHWLRLPSQSALGGAFPPLSLY